MAPLKSVCQRITLSKISLAFFLFSTIQCFIQGITHSLLHSLDMDNSALVTSIIREAKIPRGEIAWLTGNSKEFKLQLCTNMPSSVTNNFCTTVFDSRQGSVSVSIPAGFRRGVEGVPLPPRWSVAQSMTVPSSSNSSGQLGGINMPVDNRTTVFLDNQCTRALLYPDQTFTGFLREDAVLVTAQLWLLGISCFAIICQSITHLLSALVFRILLTIWSAFSMWHTGQIANYIRRLITDDGSPCGVDIFPTYFQARTGYEISILVINCMGLLLFFYLSFKLFKSHDWQTFKSTDPPREIVRIHRYVMAFYVCLQLSIFFLMTTMPLWINEVLNGAIGLIFAQRGVQLGLFITCTLFALPWLAMGSLAVHREMKKLMAGFLCLCLFYIASWAVMFHSLVFHWIFSSWAFFASLAVVAFVIMIASGVLGIICWRNFNEGLAYCLYVEDVLRRANVQREVLTNVETASVDVMEDGTKFDLVATNTVHS